MIFSPNGRYLCEFSCSVSVFLIPEGSLLWQPIKVEKLAFFTDQSTLLRCHSEMYCNIAIPISKDQIE